MKLGQTGQEPRLPGLAQPRVEHAQGAEAAEAQYTCNTLVGHLQGQYRPGQLRSRYLAASFAVQQGEGVAAGGGQGGQDGARTIVA